MIISLIALSALNSEPVILAGKEKAIKYTPTTPITIESVTDTPAIEASKERRVKSPNFEGVTELPVIQVAAERSKK